MRALQDDIVYLERAITEHNVAGLVVGWPLEPHSGQPGAQCERVRSYVTRLQQAALLMSLSVGLLDKNYGQDDNNDGDDCNTEAIDSSGLGSTPNSASALASLDVYAWDERYTSKAVQSLARDRADSASRRSKKKKKRRRKKQTHVAERQASQIDSNNDDDLAAAYILSEVVDAMFADEAEQWQKDMGF